MSHLDSFKDVEIDETCREFRTIKIDAFYMMRAAARQLLVFIEMWSFGRDPQVLYSLLLRMITDETVAAGIYSNLNTVLFDFIASFTRKEFLDLPIPVFFDLLTKS